MGVKNIYFIRHGESVANAQDVMAAHDESLSEKGILQAERMAERVRTLSIDTLIASDFLRAQQTASAIANTSSLDVSINPLFGEFFECSALNRISNEDDSVLSFRGERNEKMEIDPNWVQGDSESFKSFMDRLIAARVFLEEAEGENIVVVTHGYFIMCFVAAILFKAEVPSKAWFYAAESIHISNAGISLLAYEEGTWSVRMLNDHAHFAE